MSYVNPSAPMPGSGPAGTDRPGTVSLASTLLYVLGVLGLVGAAVSGYSTMTLAGKMKEIYVESGASSSIADTAAAAVKIGAIVGVVIAVLLAALYIVLGMFVNKGKQWARVTAWVFAGIGVCCNAFGLASSGGGFNFSGSGNTNGIDAAKVTKLTEAAIPSWISPVSLVMGVISLLLSLTVIILLALPPSHPFFRKPVQEWVPPTYPNA